MLKKDTLKASIMTKRLNAGWNEAYLKNTRILMRLPCSTPHLSDHFSSLLSY